MSNFSTVREGLRRAAVVGFIAGFALPAAAAGEIYSWRTEDGGYAFTDDAKAIPARYRGQVKTQENASLESYPRLTAPVTGANEAYSQRLAERLAHLRALNRDLDIAYARRAPRPMAESLSVQTGRFNISVPVEEGSDGPVVIEKIRFRRDGEMATRHNLVVRQGRRPIAIIRGNPLVSSVDQAPDVDGVARY
ncbi:MAG: DUF4124 domain-containing protein [Myxococcota bacterium]